MYTEWSQGQDISASYAIKPPSVAGIGCSGSRNDGGEYVDNQNMQILRKRKSRAWTTLDMDSGEV